MKAGIGTKLFAFIVIEGRVVELEVPWTGYKVDEPFKLTEMEGKEGRGIGMVGGLIIL